MEKETMLIEFVTRTYKNGWGDENETHIVRVNGKNRISQSDGIEPEDVQFYRDLSSPHDCDDIIKEVIEAVKNGVDVELVYVDEEEND